MEWLMGSSLWVVCMPLFIYFGAFADSATFQDEGILLRFPPSFDWIIGSSAYQTEGAWNSSGKGESIWDRFTHNNPSVVADGSNADIACDSYNKVEEDIALLKQLGVTSYRFSLSWPRILPSGFVESANREGIAHYGRLIKRLNEVGIKPQVTLHHFDLPQPLEDLGGWLNDSSPDWFADYADFCYQQFGDQIQFWYTINQPHIMAQTGYELGAFAPGIMDLTGTKYYIAVRTQLLAHAKAYRIYEKRYKDSQKGIMAPVFDHMYSTPLDPSSKEDISAAERWNQWGLGLFTHPIYSQTGGWPRLIEKLMENRTYKGEPRLPPFSEEEIALLKGSADFFGINYYSSFLATSTSNSTPAIPFKGTFADANVSISTDPSWPKFGEPGRPLSAWGLRGIFRWFSSHFGRQWPLYVVENGVADTPDIVLNDTFRADVFKAHLVEVAKCISRDGLNVTGYGAWAFTDNFEWTSGYTRKYGVISVDFNSPNRTRTPKQSFYWLKDLFRTSAIVTNVSTFFNDDYIT